MPYVMRSRAHARHRGWLLGGRVTLNERKKTNVWRLPRGQYYRMIEYALGYWESINSTLTSCCRLKNNKVLAPFGKNFYGITLWLLVSTLVRLEVWFHGWSSLLLNHRGIRESVFAHICLTFRKNLLIFI